MIVPISHIRHVLACPSCENRLDVALFWVGKEWVTKPVQWSTGLTHDYCPYCGQRVRFDVTNEGTKFQYGTATTGGKQTDD